jgi:hypothetical protein
MAVGDRTEANAIRNAPWPMPTLIASLGQTEALERLRGDKRSDLCDLGFPQGQDVQAVRSIHCGVRLPEVPRQSRLSIS